MALAKCTAGNDSSHGLHTPHPPSISPSTFAWPIGVPALTISWDLHDYFIITGLGYHCSLPRRPHQCLLGPSVFLLKQPDHVPSLPPILTIKLHHFATALLMTLAATLASHPVVLPFTARLSCSRLPDAHNILPFFLTPIPHI